MEPKLKQTLQLQKPEPAFDLSPTIPPKEMARRIKLAFRQMPEESALIVFAKVMTSDLPHSIKVADASRAVEMLEKRYPGTVQSFVDSEGNGLLWYLTYRDDQQSAGGFACPRTEALLLRFGADPDRRNRIGLCWRDVARHVNHDLSDQLLNTRVKI